jgi:aryl-alcohol dehydrogenase-like predicted oxidoreductase
VRYRPLGPSGAIVSAITLTLAPDPARPRASDWVALIYAALESGINSFEVNGGDLAVMDGLGAALAAVERDLVFVSVRLGPTPGPDGRRAAYSIDGLAAQVQAALAQTGLSYLNAAVLDEPPADSVGDAAEALGQIKASGAVLLTGVSSDGAALDACIASGAFDLLAMPFNITSTWRERNRLREASVRDLGVISSQPYPRCMAQLIEASKLKLAGAHRGGDALADVGTYAFLNTTPGWTAEEICVAYALTEPAIATVQVPAPPIRMLESLAAAPSREMPPGLSAQIEMARFSTETPPEQMRRA